MGTETTGLTGLTQNSAATPSLGSMELFQRKPSMRDVATAAGVSTQTVSRVLSEHPYVNESTREKVLSAVESLGYRRTHTARALVTGRTRILGLISLDTAFYSRQAFSRGVDREANACGYSIVAETVSRPDPAALAETVLKLSDRGVDGIVVAVPLREGTDELGALARRLPMVFIDRAPLDGADLLAIDQSSAAFLATTHLLELGHDTVWHVAGPEDWADASAREDAWAGVLRAAGRTVPAVIRGDWTPESGYQAGLRLASTEGVSAVLVASDEMAFGVLRAFAERGLAVPEDISVVGIDDIPLAAYAYPPLTTVRQPFEEMGAKVVRRLTTLIDRPGEEHHDERIVPQLVVRETTARHL